MSAFSGLKMVIQINQLYRYTSVFFGGTSSPFILNSTILHHLSKYEKDQDPVVLFVAQDLEEKLYCDNVLTGADDENTAIQYYTISRQVMKDADINLRQWFTNSPALTTIIDKRGLVLREITLAC